jgi:hypothetical protein
MDDTPSSLRTKRSNPAKYEKLRSNESKTMDYRALLAMTATWQSGVLAVKNKY